MHLTYENVNHAFYDLVQRIHTKKIKTHVCSSRAGEVAMIEEPVIVTYQRPTERVLLNVARDANPFFHLYESLWMLTGRNDIAPLCYYNSRYQEFSDDGKTANGAYGYRWRNAKVYDHSPIEAVDQLDILINHLKDKMASRRAVLQMWNVEDDLLKIDTSKDVCCNLSVCFSLHPELGDFYQRLDMTVFNRSNDLIWGMLGANVVHFSILQEYIAARLGAKVGVYNQITNNLHVYVERFEAEKWLNANGEVFKNLGNIMMTMVPLVNNVTRFEDELYLFVAIHACGGIKNDTWQEPFFRDVAAPMCQAFHAYKLKLWDNANWHLDQVKATDWQIAGRNWIAKRRYRHDLGISTGA
jgi:thymidylate synthase